MNRITNNERRDSLSKNALWTMLQELHYGPQGYTVKELHLSPGGVRVELSPSPNHQFRPLTRPDGSSVNLLDYDPDADQERTERETP